MENTMKRILAILLTTISLTACAGPYGHHGHHGHHVRSGSGWGWIAPAVIGGLVVYGATRPAQAEPAPVIVQPAPQPGQIIQCPPGTMPFEQRGWVRNHYNQYIQTTYIECK